MLIYIRLCAKSSTAIIWLASGVVGVAISFSDDTSAVLVLAEVLPIGARLPLRVLVGRVGACVVGGEVGACILTLDRPVTLTCLFESL
jgi:hypothetical protein